MGIRQIELLAEPVMAKLLIELGAGSRVVRLCVQIDGGFELDEKGRSRGQELKVDLAALQDAFGRAKEEDFILDDRPADLGAGIPAQQEGHLAVENFGRVGGVELVIAVEERDAPVPVVGAAFADYVDDAARTVTEFGFVAAGEDLEFENGLLVELGSGAAVDFVAIGHAIDEKDGVPPALTEDWRRAIQG